MERTQRLIGKTTKELIKLVENEELTDYEAVAICHAELWDKAQTPAGLNAEERKLRKAFAASDYYSDLLDDSISSEEYDRDGGESAMLDKMDRLNG